MDAQQISVPAGSLVSWRLDLTAATLIQVTLAQWSLTQDYSLRAWVSLYPNGIPLPSGYVTVMRSGGLPIAIYTTATPPDNTVPMPVEPGLYALNVYNLTNEHNVLGCLMIDQFGVAMALTPV